MGFKNSRFSWREIRETEQRIKNINHKDTKLNTRGLQGIVGNEMAQIVMGFSSILSVLCSTQYHCG